MQEECYYYAGMDTIGIVQPIYKYRWKYNSKNRIVKFIKPKKSTEFIHEYYTVCKQNWMQ